MAKDDAAGPGRAGQIGAAGVLGALAGAALAAHRGPRAVLLGALGGAAGLAAVDTVARARQRPGEIPALWSRIIASGAVAAPLGWAVDRFAGVGPVPVATAAGAAAGALGLRPQKVLLGPVAGAAVGVGLAGLRRVGSAGRGSAGRARRDGARRDGRFRGRWRPRRRWSGSGRRRRCCSAIRS